MSFQDTITNGEQHFIARKLGAQPDTDPVGWGIGLVVIAARRLGHPITWDDAESLTDAETAAILEAAENTGAGDRAERSAALAGLLAAITPTGDADPELPGPEPTPGPEPMPTVSTGAVSSPSTPEYRRGMPTS